MQLLTQGQWWSKSWAGGTHQGTQQAEWGRATRGGGADGVVGQSPLRSCRRRCSGSSVAGGRSGRWHTTSYGPGCPAHPHSCTAGPGSHPPYPHPHPLWAKTKEDRRKVTSLAEKLTDLCQPTHQDPTTQDSPMLATHTLTKVSR